MVHLFTSLPEMVQPAVLGALTAGIGFPILYAIVALCVKDDPHAEGRRADLRAD